MDSMNDYGVYLQDELRAGRLTRRGLLVRASVAGLSLAPFASLLGGSAWAANAAAPGPVKRGGTIRLAAQIPSANPQPVTASNAGEVFTYQPSLEYLCYPRADWTLDPRLATGWKAAPDPKTWTFTIRQGVAWHDGSPLTADDVVATFERLLDPKVGSSAGSIYHGVLSHGNIEKVGDFDVRFHLDTAFVDFPYLVSAFAYQSAILPKNYEMGSFTKGGIGTGAFILRQYVPQQSATYEANPHYWAKDMPYAAALKVAFFGDESSAVLAMQAGDVDIYPVVPLKGAEALLRSSKIDILTHA
ncbi:MAG: ABC transporter substrate-binding protein, partial [Acetobacteraceae bacterium]